MFVHVCRIPGCISPRSLSLLGRGTAATQSGIYNLWAAGSCQGAAAPQHVSNSQVAVRVFSPSFHPPELFYFNSVDMCLKYRHVFRTCLLALLKIFPFLLGDVGHFPPPLQPRLLLHWSRMKSLSEKDKYSHTPFPQFVRCLQRSQCTEQQTMHLILQHVLCFYRDEHWETKFVSYWFYSFFLK